MIEGCVRGCCCITSVVVCMLTARRAAIATVFAKLTMETCPYARSLSANTSSNFLASAVQPAASVGI